MDLMKLDVRLLSHGQMFERSNHTTSDLTTPQAICLSKHLYGFDEIRRKTFVSWSDV